MISPAMTGHVDMEQVLWSSCPNITPDRVGHIPPMIFNLAIDGSLQDLKKDIHPLDEHMGGGGGIMSLYVRAHRRIL